MYVYYLGVPLLMLSAVIDASVLVQLRVADGQPSLLIMIIVSWALLNDLPDALPWAIIGGIFADLLSVTPLGASSLAYIAAMVAVSSLFGRVGRRNVFFPPLAVTLGTVVTHAVLFVMLILAGWFVSPLTLLLRWTLPTIIMNILGILFVFRFIGILADYFRPPSVSIL